VRSEAGRIVSLVPSLTEALFSLGLGDRVVGVTDYCVHPAAGVAGKTRVGGTKDPDLDRVVALSPDLVIANHEENTERAVRKLRAAGLDVWVTYPRTVAEGAALLEELAGLGADPARVHEVVDPVRSELTRARAELERLGSRRARVFCPIWKDPWMAVGRDTYIHDLLELCGSANVFADHGDRRYPKVELAEIERAQPEVVLLPDEPYAFSAADAAELARLAIPAARSGRIHVIDGTWVSWYGPRIAQAIRELRPLLRAL